MTRWLPPVIGLVLFGAAAFVLERALRQIEFEDVLFQLQAIPFRSLLLATLLSGLDYSALSGYDWLALRYVGHRLPYRKSALAAFIGYTFSHNIGFSFLTGGSVRYRLYSAAGLSGLEIAKVVGFCSMTFGMGFLTLGGGIFLAQPPPLPPALHLPFTSARPLGALFLALSAAVFLLSLSGRRRLQFRDWSLDLPRPTLLMGQVAVSSLDWLLAGGVFYVLLPQEADLPFITVMGAFFLAQLAGLASNVPGGLGVFEGVMFLFLPPGIPPAVLLGSLLAYRLVYYLLPFVGAAVALGGYEVLERREHVGRVARRVGQWMPGILPQTLSFAVMGAGAVLLFSGIGSVARWKLVVLREILPLPVLEAAHFASCLAGTGLVLLARGLQRRLERAWFWSAVLLGAGIVLALLKGLDYEEAFLLSLVLILLAPAGRQFYRKATILGQPFSAGWLAAVSMTLGIALYLAFSSYDPADLTGGEAWWRFAFNADASRALRGGAGALVLALAYGLARWAAPRRPQPGLLTADDRLLIERLVEQSPRAAAWPALLGDKQFLFNSKRTAFLMYGVRGRSWIALGDPQGDPGESVELAWCFREECDRQGAWPAFFQVGAERLPLYLDLGLNPQPMGEEAWIDLKAFTIEGPERKPLRHALHRGTQEGLYFSVHPPADVEILIPKLRTISQAYLEDRQAREKRFSSGWFDENYLRRTPLAVIEQGNQILAFANLWPAYGKEEIAIDLVRLVPGQTAILLDFLFTHLILWSKAEGFARFNLGLCPPQGLENPVLARWNRMSSLIYPHAENFFNLQGVRLFKERYFPEWVPLYLVCPGGMVFPRVLAGLGALIGGGRGFAVR